MEGGGPPIIKQGPTLLRIWEIKVIVQVVGTNMLIEYWDAQGSPAAIDWTVVSQTRRFIPPNTKVLAIWPPKRAL